jgi:2-iminobutanoate/2-iminopropanoate deaminase
VTIRNLAILCTLVLATVASVSVHAQASRTYIDGRSGADGNIPPYSGAVSVGDTLYLAGALGTDENLEVPDDPADEARNVMNAIKNNVEAAGMTMDDIVSIQVY